MGSPDSDEAASTDEKPEHRVCITKPFYFGLYEVTQEQWEAVMTMRPWSGKPYVKEGSDYAATYVSWEDAQAFCDRLSKKEGVTYRLPTEAEWEYACRAGTTTVYHFGNDASRLGDYASFRVNVRQVDDKHAHRVGQKKPNPFGLYDMYGNVWEWCADGFRWDYYDDSPESDPQGPSETYSCRVFRGGGWYDRAKECRSANRYRGCLPSLRSVTGGFRLARSPSGK